ncbi:hypothetical protein GCM10007891_09760 [Methylophaga thalassica]|uniref:Uncharacterized protein n=1 Tax=Methylophaga thalassica TaxID=40223 RepID=A0ABQ5TSJ0_9GAMM|nr:hypothetical protein GCM10007891_09760 [Methylophaga thalassica]
MLNGGERLIIQTTDAYLVNAELFGKFGEQQEKYPKAALLLVLIRVLIQS